MAHDAPTNLPSSPNRLRVPLRGHQARSIDATDVFRRQPSLSLPPFLHQIKTNVILDKSRVSPILRIDIGNDADL